MIEETRRSSNKIYNYAEYLLGLLETLTRKERQVEKKINEDEKELELIEHCLTKKAIKLEKRLKKDKVKDDEKMAAAMAMKFWFENSSTTKTGGM